MSHTIEPLWALCSTQYWNVGPPPCLNKVRCTAHGPLFSWDYDIWEIHVSKHPRFLNVLIHTQTVYIRPISCRGSGLGTRLQKEIILPSCSWANFLNMCLSIKAIALSSVVHEGMPNFFVVYFCPIHWPRASFKQPVSSQGWFFLMLSIRFLDKPKEALSSSHL